MPSDKANEWQKVQDITGNALPNLGGERFNVLGGDFGHALDLDDGHLVIGDPFFGLSETNNYAGFSIWEAVSPTPTDPWVKSYEQFEKLGSRESTLGVSVGVTGVFAIVGDSDAEDDRCEVTNIDEAGLTVTTKASSRLMCRAAKFG